MRGSRLRKLAMSSFGSISLVAALALAGVPSSAASVDADKVAIEAVQRSSVVGVVGEDGSTIFSAEGIEIVVPEVQSAELSSENDSTRAGPIDCTLGVHYPHGSTHVAGTINGVANGTCTGGAVTSLKLHYSLVRVSPNNTQWAAPMAENAGKSTIQNNKGVSCTAGPGTFQGWAQLEVVPPPGYYLTTPAVVGTYGEARQVSCGGSGPLSTGSDISQSMTLTFAPKAPAN